MLFGKPVRPTDSLARWLSVSFALELRERGSSRHCCVRSSVSQKATSRRRGRTSPSGGRASKFLQRTRELQRRGSAAVAAVRPRAAAVRTREAFRALLPKGSYLLLLAPIVWRSSRAFVPQLFGTNASPGSTDGVKGVADPAFGASIRRLSCHRELLRRRTTKQRVAARRAQA